MLFPMLVAAAIASSSPIPPPPALPNLSVLSYNIHGVPWPIAMHRPHALRQIGQALAEMRLEGKQPNVVVLQEAFTRRAKRMVSLGDYRYIVAGPSRHDRFVPPEDPEQRLFSSRDRAIKGEHVGKIEDSGLLVMSDYPIIAVKRMPYPRFACAGFDCLANKGMLLVQIQVPGIAQPVVIVDTHMNSRGASGVADVRSDRAYDWQVQSLHQFVRANVPSDAPAIVAGDFNIGNVPNRLADVTADGGIMPGGIDAVRQAVNGTVENPDSANTAAIARHGKDWMFGRSGSRTELSLQSVTVPFGRGADGHMLSDHMGYIAHYRVESRPEQGTP